MNVVTSEKQVSIKVDNIKIDPHTQTEKEFYPQSLRKYIVKYIQKIRKSSSLYEA